MESVTIPGGPSQSGPRRGQVGRGPAICAAALLSTTVLSSPASAQTVEELKAQIDALQKQVDGLEQKPAAAPVQAVVGGDKPRSYKLPGTDTSLQIGGYAKGDAIYDVKSQNGESFAASLIPLSGTAEDRQEGHVRFHARQSRLWFKTWTPTDLGEVRTHIEGDFEGAGGNETFSNSSTLRLRHAYGTLGGLLVGQNWTNFMSLHSYPETLDFFGPTGMPFIRQAQIRYTFTPRQDTAISFSAENPESDGRTAAGPRLDESLGGIGFDRAADLTAAIKYTGQAYTAKFAGVGRWLTAENGLGGAADIDETEFGWGLHASLSATVFGRDTVQVNLQGGDGIGRYMLAPGLGAFLDADGNLDTVTQYGAVVGYIHHWNDYLRSQVAWGHVEVDDDDVPETVASTLDTVHFNLQWAPVPRVSLGIEGIYGRAEVDNNTFGDDTNDQWRIQTSGRFTF